MWVGSAERRRKGNIGSCGAPGDFEREHKIAEKAIGYDESEHDGYVGPFGGWGEMELL